MISITRSAALRAIYELFEEGTLSGLSDEQLVERFVARRDETAFEALVVRHGRSVLAVCRDVLHDGHDAEDAFQATFLMLARKAGSLWVRGSIAAWLHRVARRVSVEANVRKARRQRFEKTGLDIDTAELKAGGHWESLLEILHEEIDRLPEKYRAPIVLCELGSLTREQAAHRLGWQPGTVAGRLARARSILRDRVGRRGKVEPGGLATVFAARRAAGRDVPRSFIEQAANLPILSLPTTITPSGFAFVGSAELALGVTRSMIMTTLKYSAVMSIAAGLALAVVSSALTSGRPETTPVAVASILSDQAGAGLTGPPDVGRAGVPLSGAIVLQDGSPAKGASVFVSTVEHAYGHGEVRVGTITADTGEFHLDIPHVDVSLPGIVGTGTLWAYRPGLLVASMSVYRGALPPGLPQRLVLGLPTRAPFQVFGPDGKAVERAMIEPRVLARNSAQVPDRLASMIGAEIITDIHGRAVMTAFFPEEVTAVRVTAKGYGQQDFRFAPQQLNSETKVVRLRPVGGLKGRVVGNPDAVRHRPLNISGFSPPDGPRQYSYNRQISTDEDGRFEVSEIAVGPHGVSTVPRFDFAWWAGSDGLVEVEPGKTSEVVLTLKPAVKVRGVVREKGTDKPIAGVQVAAALAETGAMTSGQDGSYEGYVPRDPTFITERYIPAGYARPLYSLPQFLIPEDAVDFTLPAIELMKAGEVPGLVVDERARPAAGAEVEASWMMDETQVGTDPHQLSVRTGPDGRFVFQGVPLGAEVSLSARRRGLRTLEPSPARVGEATILRLSPSNCVAMEGRVLDASGQPLAGANVHLRVRNRTTAFALAEEEELVELEGGFVLVTDVEGRFRTPAELELDRAYMAYAHANGHRFDRTGWTTGQSRSFPDMKLEADAATP
jgi:RNA polymerase sigma factor (sigma-70 family)